MTLFILINNLFFLSFFFAFYTNFLFTVLIFYYFSSFVKDMKFFFFFMFDLTRLLLCYISNRNSFFYSLTFFRVHNLYMNNNFLNFFFSLLFSKDFMLKSLFNFSFKEFIKLVLFFVCNVIFFFSVLLWILFDPMLIVYQSLFNLKIFGFFLCVGYDGLSLLFIFLTCFILPLCFLFNWNNHRDFLLEYLICIFCIEILLLFVFSVSNVLFFFIFFEFILIPFFILIGLYGSRDRKVHASYMLVFYTLFGSVFMLLSILFLFFHVGSTNYYILFYTEFSSYFDSILWFAFFVSFGIKVPMYPFHIWLPEAHVESPTEGSVILAAILLKIGGYGFFRILLPIFPYCTLYFSSFILVICFLSVIYISFTTLRQTDIKRIIAYSSVAHMNVAIIGFICLNVFSIVGSILLMLGHGFVSGGLFFLIGILYDRFKTKSLKYYSGIMFVMPIFSSIFFFFILGNISLPMTCNFIGEFLILLGALIGNNYIGISAICLSIYFCSCYSVFLFNRLAFGLPRRITIVRDISVLEFSLLLPLIIMILFLGILPTSFIDVFYYYVRWLLFFCYNASF